MANDRYQQFINPHGFIAKLEEYIDKLEEKNGRLRDMLAFAMDVINEEAIADDIKLDEIQKELERTAKKSLTCPFCMEPGFDAVGLKMHLGLIGCEEYEQLPDAPIMEIEDE